MIYLLLFPVPGAEINVDSFNSDDIIVPLLVAIAGVIALILIVLITILCWCNVKHLHQKRKLASTNFSQCEDNGYQVSNIQSDEQKSISDMVKEDDNTIPSHTPEPDVLKSDIKNNAAYGALLQSSFPEYADPRTFKSRARQVFRPSETQSVEAYAITRL